MLRLIRVLACGLVVAAGCAAHAQEDSRLRADALAMYGQARPYMDAPIEKLRHDLDELHGLKIDDDPSRLEDILEQVSETVSTQLPRVPNLVAREDITLEEERLQQTMRPSLSGGRGGGGAMTAATDRQMVITAERQYEFVIRRVPGDDNLIIFNESRHEIKTQKEPSNPPLATGFSGMWMMFLPGTLEEQRFRYLGTQKVHGHQTSVIAFAQLPEKVQVPGKITARDGSIVPMLHQGVVWVDEETGEILQIRTDLLAPLPVIQSDKLVSTVEFMEVKLPGLEEKLWLPKKVELAWNMYGQNGGEIHRYSNYRLYKAKVRILSPGETPKAGEDDDQ